MRWRPPRARRRGPDLVLGREHAAAPGEELTDTTIVCLWEFCDHLGYGGESELFLLDDGALYTLTGDLWPWLLEGASEAPGGPGTPAQWKGQPAGQIAREFSGDGRHNLAWKQID